MKDIYKTWSSPLLTVSIYLILSVVATSCSALNSYYNRDGEIHKQISMLEIGAYKKDVMDAIKYPPDFVNKEAMEGGVREVLIYRGSYSPNGWMSAGTPTVYRLVFENNRLVTVDSDVDYEQVRIDEQRRIENARRETVERRLSAILEAQKQQKEEKKKEEQKKD